MSIAGAKPVSALQGAVGVALLARPDAALGALAAPETAFARRVTRILGARLAMQAAVVQVNRGKVVLVATGWIDAIHALSMLMVAARSARWRWAALASAGFAGLGAFATDRTIGRQRS